MKKRMQWMGLVIAGLLVVLAAYGLSQYGPPEPPQPPQPPTPQQQGGVALLAATLTVAQEVPPPNAATPPTARGVAVLLFDPATSTLNFSLAYVGLSGAAVAAHFHNGAVGAAGPVVQTICGPPNQNPLLGACPTTPSGFLTGTWSVPAGLVPTLLAGGLYINVHTSLNPPGEIRGQVVPVP
ncbi:MAG: CHRD domain-containing protein [Candidatus Bipolaricaulota bacterium]|nr:CHRD domain-containing protein [Candidatus Bipolaricaulota bacterium]